MTGRVLLGAVAALALAPAAASAASVVRDAEDAGGPLDVAAASLRQDGEELTFSARTLGEWSAGRLSAASRRIICLDLQGKGSACVVGRRGTGAPALSFQRAGAAGPHLIPATIRRPNDSLVEATFKVAETGLTPGTFRWRVRSSWVGPECQEPACRDLAPDAGTVSDTLRPPVPTGCEPAGANTRSSGPGGRRRVALTFDDGPSEFTADVLDLFKRKDAVATFFVIGGQVSGRAGVLRRALREGHAVGNHSHTHASLAGGGAGELSRAQAAIRRALGYTPCVFRPPYGATSSLLAGQARERGMNTILWDVDPLDWQRPGADAIHSRVVGATRPGSIVLSHDGGGPRGGTVAAYGRIIDTLRRRGYAFVTVPQLLGLKPVYG